MPTGDGCLYVAFWCRFTMKRIFCRFDRGPLDGLLKDLGVRFLNPLSYEKNPLLEQQGNDGNVVTMLVKVEGIGIGKKTESPFPFLKERGDEFLETS